MNLGKVAVLMGGKSAEREISLMSGNGVLKALRSKGVDAHAFDPKERDVFDLRKEGFARCFIALHGRGGEDGTIQGALETLGIPYTGSGVMGSAIGMDKWRTKMVWIANGLPTPRFRILEEKTNWSSVARELKLPLIVKPANEGSTLGLTKVSESCAKIQHLGMGTDEAGTTSLDEGLRLERIRETLEVAKEEYEAMKGELKRFYGS